MDQLLTTHDLAEQLRLADETVRYWRHVGVGPRYLKVGRNIRYRTADVEAWLKSREQVKA